MIVDIDGERFHLATLHTDAKAAKMQLQQLVTRGDADWYPLAGGGGAGQLACRESRASRRMPEPG